MANYWLDLSKIDSVIESLAHYLSIMQGGVYASLSEANMDLKSFIEDYAQRYPAHRKNMANINVKLYCKPLNDLYQVTHLSFDNKMKDW